MNASTHELLSTDPYIKYYFLSCPDQQEQQSAIGQTSKTTRVYSGSTHSKRQSIL